MGHGMQYFYMSVSVSVVVIESACFSPLAQYAHRPVEGGPVYLQHGSKPTYGNENTRGYLFEEAATITPHLPAHDLFGAHRTFDTAYETLALSIGRVPLLMRVELDAVCTVADRAAPVSMELKTAPRVAGVHMNQRMLQNWWQALLGNVQLLVEGRHIERTDATGQKTCTWRVSDMVVTDVQAARRVPVSHFLVEDGAVVYRPDVPVAADAAAPESPVDEALLVAYAVAHSPLVKTAFFASDPNLGRILAAIGYAGITDLDVRGVKLWLGDVLVADKGERNPDYQEADGQRVMKEPEILVRIALGRGTVAQTVYTCDFSHEYVSINADYRS